VVVVVVFVVAGGSVINVTVVFRLKASEDVRLIFFSASVIVAGTNRTAFPSCLIEL
jgi:hypothetical protein